MRSTGEVMGMDDDLGIAFAKSQMAARPALPTGGSVFLSVKDADKPRAVVIARELIELGFTIFSTSGTARFLEGHGLEVRAINKLAEGRPHAVDMIKNGQLQMVINTPSGMIPRHDENQIRAAALIHGVSTMTTLIGAWAAFLGIRAMKQRGVGVRSLQSYRQNTVAAG